MRHRFASVTLGIVVSASCSDTAAPPPPPSSPPPLYYLKAPDGSGDGQVDTVLGTLALPFRVLVRRGDTAAPGVVVLWETASDTLTGIQGIRVFSVTDSDGIATSPFRLTFGREAGVYPVRASVPGVVSPGPISIGTDTPCGSGLCFTATATPGHATQLRYVSGSGQIDTTSATLGTDYVVQVVDSYENPVAGVRIDWAVTAGGGSITPTQNATSAPSGHATARHTLGPAEGPQEVRATAAALPLAPNVTFTATAFKPGAVASVTLTPKSPVIAVGGTVQLSALLRDAHGLTLSGRSITWTSDHTTVATVDPNGLATGVGPGVAAITATSEGVSDTAHITVFELTAGFLVSLTAGSAHTCGLSSDGAAYCWGSNAAGALGNGSTTNSSVPVAVGAGLRFSTLAAGGYHTCGLAQLGAAYCWGWNLYGQLGDNTLTDRATPVPVAGALSLETLAAMGGSAHSCALRSDGTAYCWGLNDMGQLGIGTATGPAVCHTDPQSPDLVYTCSTVPLAVVGGLRFSAIAAGGEFTCGLTSTGAAYCWGYNHWGQLGLGTVGPETCVFGGFPYECSTIPRAVAGGLSFSTLTLGGGHSCGLTSAGVAYCWGFNAQGQLGDGTGELRSFAPAAVAGGLRFTALTAGGSHTCGITDTGAAYCWGDNTNGQLGNGSHTLSETPVPVAGGLRFRALLAGGAHTCGLTDSGAAVCWGANSSGQLGNGSLTDSSVPVSVSPP